MNGSLTSYFRMLKTSSNSIIINWYGKFFTKKNRRNGFEFWINLNSFTTRLKTNVHFRLTTLQQTWHNFLLSSKPFSVFIFLTFNIFFFLSFNNSNGSATIMFPHICVNKTKNLTWTSDCNSKVNQQNPTATTYRRRCQ